MLAEKAAVGGYVWLAAELEKAIEAGGILAGERLPSTKKLATRYGVSPETARRAAKRLESRGLLISAHRQGFRLRAGGHDPDRGLPMAFVVSAAEKPDLWNEFYRHLFAGLQQAAAKRDWALLAVGVGERSVDEVVTQLRACRVCGMVLDAGNGDLLAAVAKLGMPVVMVDSWHQSMKLDAVVQDSFQGALLAVDYLRSRGHRRLGWLGSISRSIQHMERFGGIAAALAAAGLLPAPAFRRDTPKEKMATEARRMLSRADRPTGFLGLWQDEAATLVRTGRELGLRHGRDFEVVGWSAEETYDTNYRPHFNGGPVPATVVWSITDLAQMALSRLAERRTKPSLSPIMIKVPARLRLPEQAVV